MKCDSRQIMYQPHIVRLAWQDTHRSQSCCLALTFAIVPTLHHLAPQATQPAADKVRVRHSQWCITAITQSLKDKTITPASGALEQTDYLLPNKRCHEMKNYENLRNRIAQTTLRGAPPQQQCFSQKQTQLHHPLKAYEKQKKKIAGRCPICAVVPVICGAFAKCLPSGVAAGIAHSR